NDVLAACHLAARDSGLAAGLAVLCSTMSPAAGSTGLAVLPAGFVSMAGLAAFDLPGGRVEIVRWNGVPADPSWSLGVLWIRLGLSEALRDSCVRYLRDRRTGDSTLLQQQLVKGTLADALAEQLEIRAVLTGLAPRDVTPTLVNGLNRQVTHADRTLLRLLGATSMLLGGPG